MSHKDTALYGNIFRSILQEANNRNIEIRWNSLKVDFEDALINAFTETFPLVNIEGCYFHFGQAINRWLQNHGLIGTFSKYYLYYYIK